MKIKKLCFLILLLSVNLMAGYTIGDTVRNFSLTDCSGSNVNLYDYYWQENGGQSYVVLINFGEPW